jgi:hypothetical protein
MTRRTASKLLLILWMLSGAVAVQAQAAQDPFSDAWGHIIMKEYAAANREVAKAEKEGHCKGAFTPSPDLSAMVARRAKQ